MYVCMYVYIYIYMCVCMVYIYIYRERESGATVRAPLKEPFNVHPPPPSWAVTLSWELLPCGLCLGSRSLGDHPPKP